MRRKFEKTDLIIAVIAVGLLIYTGYRAAVLSLTIDEAVTFNIFVPLKFMDIISYKVISTNNHILNTLLIKFFSFLFGNSEFVIRLPNFFSHIVYLTFTYLIVKKLSNPILVVCGFMLLNLNPYLLDFFSAARGYGMAVSLMTVSIYYLLEFKTANKNKHLILSLVFACLALLTNFSLLIFFASLIIIINLIWITSGEKKITFKELMKKNIPIGVIFIIISIILYEPIRRIIKFDCLYFGGNIGFWHDTVGSLIDSSLYGQSYLVNAGIIKIFVLLTLIMMSFVISLNSIKTKRFSINNSFTLFFLLLVLPCFVSVCQHLILGSKFLVDRMTIFFIPLFFLALIYFINQYFNTKKFNIAKYIIVIIMTILMSVHTGLSANTTYFFNWSFDSQTKEMLNDLHRIAINDHKTKINLGISFFYEPSINYYIQTKKYDWINMVENKGLTIGNYDYYFIMNEDKDFIKKYSKQIVKEYPFSGAFLIK